jgi:hypothetical protein
MAEKVCKNCQYFRENHWCSNSQSERNRQDVLPSDTCGGFTLRGQKAPLGMRLKVKGLAWLNRRKK